MYPYIKRLLAILISGIAIIVLSPLLAIVAIAIKIDSKGPILFKQKRLGKDNSHFMIYKFRSMYVDAPAEMPTHLLKDPSAMITKVGAFLRKTSLDELPQLFNIFKGEMAIVGPRPALWNQFDLIAERDKNMVNSIRPGLTGWAQINGRDELEIADKVALDAYYYKHLSFIFDLKCFFGTFVSVLKSDGVLEGGPEQNKEK
ncbi:sugar transferase [Streptococcus iniae]|uniref:Capsular biosynthesis protein n=1 Tax=Streptococcus iniae TaxID=1346 RepID=A0A3L8GLY4_STRIN|nr:sugar transferase [Streptococcus iniae]AGM98614.1 CpsF [Streptococcus iniae SF1]AHY15643.1 capsular biosynthesis protein [Streptococcus iniae]AHY17512.1 capsular biosynthesis protein [Streptococcus iniae]AJG25813.1 capsular biosynthesis protein [Streptococcus iniae]APD31685.1 lipid carrier--UDP-N-acetylgalactosaminyltransferase [Streptococcus iniae]